MTKRGRRHQPKSQSLSMDWFTNPAIDGVDNPVFRTVHRRGGEGGNNIDLINRYSITPPLPPPTVHNFVDNSAEEDPDGCHPNLQEHIDGVKMCAETLRHFGIGNPYQFLRSWSTDEILAALDDMIGQELEGYIIRRPAGWLWNHLSRRPQDETL